MKSFQFWIVAFDNCKFRNKEYAVKTNNTWNFWQGIGIWPFLVWPAPTIGQVLSNTTIFFSEQWRYHTLVLPGCTITTLLGVVTEGRGLNVSYFQCQLSVEIEIKKVFTAKQHLSLVHFICCSKLKVSLPQCQINN